MSNKTDQSNGTNESSEGKAEKDEVLTGSKNSPNLKISPKKKKNYNIPSFVISHQDP